MEAIRQVALDLLGCEKVTLFLVFKRQQELRATDIECGHNVIRCKFGEGIAGTVAKTGKLMNVPDAYAHPLFLAQVDRITGYRTRNILCASISDMNGRIVAVLQALNKVDGKQFTSADEHNIQLFSTHLGNTLSKAKLHDKALREKQRVSDLYQTFKALSGARNLEEVLDLARCALRGILHASVVFVFILDTPRNELWAKYSLEAEPHMVRVQLGQGLVGRAASENRPVVMSGGAQPRSQRSFNLLNADSVTRAPFASSPPPTPTRMPCGSLLPSTSSPRMPCASSPLATAAAATATTTAVAATQPEGSIPAAPPSGSPKSAPAYPSIATAPAALPSGSPKSASAPAKISTAPAALPTTSAISISATLPVPPPAPAVEPSSSPKSALATPGIATTTSALPSVPPQSASASQTMDTAPAATPRPFLGPQKPAFAGQTFEADLAGASPAKAIVLAPAFALAAGAVTNAIRHSAVSRASPQPPSPSSSSSSAPECGGPGSHRPASYAPNPACAPRRACAQLAGAAAGCR
ncbi:hypothetical protein DUNSADRAFT_2079 [Dunaliella salina]|uniref:GAF domain-containing protein n=1 Tax=Dunaliella salina TaxID=3046 RepID=A0ABQ7FWN4_DUNSA|nr:hypothetical protein DUNSADRAFT_2079 [Dunaliella salina]|eukprot:KAF5826772.1 hypothetical protein DUNSADRAFT_2079 [Dunaliella salina]